MLRKFSCPAPASVTKALNNRQRTNHFSVGTLAEFVEASGTRHPGFVGGDLKDVAASDALMEKLESMFPAPTARHEWLDDVTGGFPNVPAYIAGQPLNMRRRVKRDHEASPIAIVLDTTSSGGIGESLIRKRGVAALALARALSARRPVELYVSSSLGANDGGACFQFYKIDSAPLDLARAAYCLCDAGAARAGFYPFAYRSLGNGNWPYNNFKAYRENFRDIVKQALPHVEDVIAMPGVFIGELEFNNPVAWIAKHVKAHGDVDLGED